MYNKRLSDYLIWYVKIRGLLVTKMVIVEKLQKDPNGLNDHWGLFKLGYFREFKLRKFIL